MSGSVGGAGSNPYQYLTDTTNNTTQAPKAQEKPQERGTLEKIGKSTATGIALTTAVGTATVVATAAGGALLAATPIGWGLMAGGLCAAAWSIWASH